MRWRGDEVRESLSTNTKEKARHAGLFLIYGSPSLDHSTWGAEKNGIDRGNVCKDTASRTDQYIGIAMEDGIFEELIGAIQINVALCD